MNTKWIEGVRARFVQVYGKKRGMAVCNVVIPAVMGDFRKSLLAAQPGISVSEQYRTDDRKTDVTLTGHKELRSGHEVGVIEKIEIGGVPVSLGSSELVV